MSAGRCSPEPSRECSSMFLTMELARLPCCTTFSRLSLQHAGQFVDLLPRLVVERGGLEHLVQFVGQFDRERREIVDEIERVLDLVGDAGGELAERGQLLGLDQPVLCGAQVLERRDSSRVRASTSSNSRTFSMAITAWSAKVVTSSICLSVKGSTLRRVKHDDADGTPSRSSGTPSMVRKSPISGISVKV